MFTLAVWFLASPAPVLAQGADAGVLTLWVEKEYWTWDNPLSSEFSINGKTTNIHTSETFEPVANYFMEHHYDQDDSSRVGQQGQWSHFQNRTGGQGERRSRNGDEPGPVGVPERHRLGFEDGKFSHPLGPDVKEVTLTYNVYYAASRRENDKGRQVTDADPANKLVYSRSELTIDIRQSTYGIRRP